MDAESIVNAAITGDKDATLTAFNAAIAAKVNDALEVKKVEIASNLLGTEETTNELETTEVEVDGSESSDAAETAAADDSISN